MNELQLMQISSDFLKFRPSTAYKIRYTFELCDNIELLSDAKRLVGEFDFGVTKLCIDKIHRSFHAHPVVDLFDHRCSRQV
jgi:hypothetical protein